MRQLAQLLRRAKRGVKDRLTAVVRQSERSLLVGLVLIATVISAASGVALAHYYSVDVLSSLLYEPYDCIADWGMNVGHHCFSDYAIPANFALLSNPWEPYPAFMPADFMPAHNNYPAGALIPQLIFGTIGHWLDAPRLGLLGYLLALTIACLVPAVWAARSARGLERLVVFVACFAAAIPAWMAIDRGNSVGFVVPIMLVYLIALCRQRWGLVTVMVVLAALVKPQFVVLAVVLLAARQWRFGVIGLGGVVISNVAAYALWPQNFPGTITDTMHNTLGYGSFSMSTSVENVSFAKGLLTIPDGIIARQHGGVIPDGFLAGPRSAIGYAVLMLVVVCVIALGRRIPPVMVGIVLLATASLFPAVSFRYYLIFALPVAALVIRDPDGPPATGIFDRFAAAGDRRRLVGVAVSVACAISIAQIALPSPPSHISTLELVGATQEFLNLVITSALLTPLLWLATCVVIIVSYARRPVVSKIDAAEVAPDDLVSAEVGATTSEPMLEFVPLGLA